VDIKLVHDRLESYLRGVDLDDVATAIANGTGIKLAEARNHIATHVGEVRVAMRFVGPAITPRARVLEVGSGIGLFAGFMRSIGVDITELEPVGVGFQFIGEARSALAQYTHPSSHLDIGVEDLDSALHGRFDLVFSLNVLEHLADWQLALERCASVLSDGGRMMHSHPNYALPYEPHFGVPLVPFRPGWTSRFLPRRISESDTWASLNWITARQVRRWCRVRSMAVEFRKGVLADAVSRVTTDPLFRERHSGIAGQAARLASRLRLTSLLRRLPAALASPVEYTIRRVS
jgi:2-polyprenyl-3-methyl-5-hydroxy-6-metoxy-1,4-benzoquinol methylase